MPKSFGRNTPSLKRSVGPDKPPKCGSKSTCAFADPHAIASVLLCLRTASGRCIISICRHSVLASSLRSIGAEKGRHCRVRELDHRYNERMFKVVLFNWGRSHNVVAMLSQCSYGVDLTYPSSSNTNQLASRHQQQRKKASFSYIRCSSGSQWELIPDI